MAEIWENDNSIFVHQLDNVLTNFSQKADFWLPLVTGRLVFVYVIMS